MFLSLSVLEQDYMKSFLTIFVEPLRIMDYCYGKNLLNFGVDPFGLGLINVKDFCYNVCDLLRPF